jgi:hypothetical protein
MQRHLSRFASLLTCSVVMGSCDSATPPAPPPPPPKAPPPAPAPTTTATRAPSAELHSGKALSLNPHPSTTGGAAVAAVPDPYAGVAEMLFAQDKAVDAMQPAELAYELMPTEPEIRWVFGLVMLAKNKRTDDAIAAWEAIIKDTPEYAEQLGLADRLKVIKTYTKGASHGGTKAPPGGPSSAPAGPSSKPAKK